MGTKKKIAELVPSILLFFFLLVFFHQKDNHKKKKKKKKSMGDYEDWEEEMGYDSEEDMSYESDYDFDEEEEEEEEEEGEEKFECLLDLSDEILYHVFSFLSVRDLASVLKGLFLLEGKGR